MGCTLRGTAFFDFHQFDYFVKNMTKALSKLNDWPQFSLDLRHRDNPCSECAHHQRGSPIRLLCLRYERVTKYLAQLISRSDKYQQWSYWNQKAWRSWGQLEFLQHSHHSESSSDPPRGDCANVYHHPVWGSGAREDYFSMNAIPSSLAGVH